MYYKSTRNSLVKLTSKESIVKGISDDGGLFVPYSFPKYSYEDIYKLSSYSYTDKAFYILKNFLTDFDKCVLRSCIEKSYENKKFEFDNPSPVISIKNEKNIYMLELWHGPTCAFKDIALQFLPHILTESAFDIFNKKEAIILVATSGDTGKAALEGFKDVENTRIIVFYPENGVSEIQKFQMATQRGSNVRVCGVNGNFDDTQSAIKKIFTNDEVKKQLEKNNMFFSSANSINLGRLIPQIVYYFSAYCDVMNREEIMSGKKVNIAVPTGNFGNILAAFYAKEMGLPINKLICASNSNNVLYDFIKTGIYDRNRKFNKTISPSIDILISSNLERLLYHSTGCDDKKIKCWMKNLDEFGKYEIDENTKSKINDIFYGGYCTENNTKKTIKKMFFDNGYLCDPHTAVAASVYNDYITATNDKNTPVIIVSTASPYKFSRNVLSAINEKMYDDKDDFDCNNILSKETKTKIPTQIKNIDRRKIRFNDICNKDSILEKIKEYLNIK